MSDNSQIPTKEEIIKNMAKHLQTHMQDGEEVLLRTYDLAFIKGKMEAIDEMKKSKWLFYFNDLIFGFFNSNYNYYWNT